MTAKSIGLNLCKSFTGWIIIKGRVFDQR